MIDDRVLSEVAAAISRVLRPHLATSAALRDAVSEIARQLLAAVRESESQAQGAEIKLTPPLPVGPVSTRAPESAPSAKLAPSPTPEKPMPTAPIGHQVCEIADLIKGGSRGASCAGVLMGGLQRSHVEVKERRAEWEAKLAPRARQSRAQATGHGPCGADPRLLAIVRRCRLKAEACKFVASHRGDISRHPEKEVLIAKAKQMDDCFLWMLFRSGHATSPEQAAAIARNYEALADAVELAGIALLLPQLAEETLCEVLQFVATASSALRVALQSTWLSKGDRDQDKAHDWLREVTASQRVFVRSHMQLDDPADPASGPALRQQISATKRQLEGRLASLKATRASIATIKYHAERLPSSDGPDQLDHWRRISASLVSLHEAGVPVNDPQVMRAIGLAAARTASGEAPGLPLVAQVVEHVTSQANGKPAPAVSKPTATGTAETVEMVVGRAETELSEALVFALNAKSDVADNPFEETDKLWEALNWLASDYRHAKINGGCSDLSKSLQDRVDGWHYLGGQSPITLGRYESDYRCVWSGRTYEVCEHIKTGRSKDPRHTIRVAFAWDPDGQIVVVGYIGQHQRTSAT